MLKMLNLNLPEGSLAVSYTDLGVDHGRVYLLLHGGAGPSTFAALAATLSLNARVLVPTHPGFEGTVRPPWFSRVLDLGDLYVRMIEALDLRNVVVIGNSLGGWIASEIAVRPSTRIAKVVLLNAVGLDVGSGKPIVDPTAVPPETRSALAFYDPAKFGFKPVDAEAASKLVANQKTLMAYAGEPFMHDPTLRYRLSQVRIPTVIGWGESDGIAGVDYGREFASCIPGAKFELIEKAGHFPQIERQDAVLDLIGAPSR